MNKSVQFSRISIRLPKSSSSSSQIEPTALWLRELPSGDSIDGFDLFPSDDDVTEFGNDVVVVVDESVIFNPG